MSGVLTGGERERGERERETQTDRQTEEKEKKEEEVVVVVSNWILMSCQPYSVTSVSTHKPEHRHESTNINNSSDDYVNMPTSDLQRETLSKHKYSMGNLTAAQTAYVPQ